MNTKQNISGQTRENDNLPQLLEALKQEKNDLKVPGGYFDSLSPRIIDSIKKKSNKADFILTMFRKPVLWAPVLAVMVVAVLLIFTIPARRVAPIPVADEWAEINMAYDGSYAEEAILAESYSIDNEIEKSESNFLSVSTEGNNQATDDEITEYLKDQDIDIDLITDK
jgi:hypothetical protein